MKTTALASIKHARTRRIDLGVRRAARVEPSIYSANQRPALRCVWTHNPMTGRLEMRWQESTPSYTAATQRGRVALADQNGRAAWAVGAERAP